MGTLHYGKSLTVNLDDRSAAHLDALLMEVAGKPFQLHVTMGGAHDWDLISLSVNSGGPLWLQYNNSGPIDINWSLVEDLRDRVKSSRFVTVPFDFDGTA